MYFSNRVTCNFANLYTLIRLFRLALSLLLTSHSKKEFSETLAYSWAILDFFSILTAQLRNKARRNGLTKVSPKSPVFSRHLSWLHRCRGEGARTVSHILMWGNVLTLFYCLCIYLELGKPHEGNRGNFRWRSGNEILRSTYSTGLNRSVTCFDRRFNTDSADQPDHSRKWFTCCQKVFL